MLTSLLHGRPRGWLLLTALALPLGWVSLGHLYAALNDSAKARVKRVMTEFDPGTGVTRAFDGKGVAILRDTLGVPLLATLPLPADPPPLQGKVTRTLLGRYAVRLEQQITAAPASGADSTSAAPPKPYRPDHLLLEVTLEENDTGEWRVLADIGYQAEPNVWARVPWWRKDGIAPSNELLRVDRHRTIPVLFNITTPTTIEALAAFLREHWVGAAKALNPDYAAPPLAVKPRDFEKLVVHPLMGVLPADFSSVPVLTQVFVFNTLNGELQLLMLLNLEMGLLVLMVRYGRLVALARWSRDPAAAVRAAKTGRYVSAELGSWIVFWGLLGTLVFLALAVVQLRISASSAVMMSILAQMGTVMAQAFLTTIVSSSLQRLLAMLEAVVFAAEDRIAEQPVAPKPSPAPAVRPQVRQMRVALPLLDATPAPVPAAVGMSRRET